MTDLSVPDGPKMLRETFCVAQAAIGYGPSVDLNQHIERLQRLADECDRHRPLGPDGRHGDRHTPTCGCEDGLIMPADSWAHYAEPDRPEPVDPTTVRIGDVVEVEAADGSWLVRARVHLVDPGSSYPFAVSVLSIGGSVIWPWLADAAVRVVRWAEPEPDPAQVAVLAEHVAQVDADLNMFNVVEPLDYARELYRRGVRAGEVDGDG